MGVRGFASWLDAHAAHCCNLRVLERGSTVLIDGNGLCWYLLLQGADTRVRLDDYGAFGMAVTRALSALSAAGLAPRVYLDGRATRLKAHTLSARRASRADARERLQAALLDGRGAAALELLPEPPLMLQQCAASVEALGVPLIRCEGEADVDLAADAAAAAGSCYVLASDSDFCFFRGVEYVPLAQLALSTCEPAAEGGEAATGPWPLHTLPAAAGGAPLVATSRVWSRRVLSEVSDLPEEALVEWAVLGGNDHTGRFEPSEWGDLLGLVVGSGGSSCERLEAIREWLREQIAAAEAVDGRVVSASAAARVEALAACVAGCSAELFEALRFSAALYEHGDLSCFQLDERHAEAEVEVIMRRDLQPTGSSAAAAIGHLALAEIEMGSVVLHHRPPPPPIGADTGPAAGAAAESRAQESRAACAPHHAQALRRLLSGERRPAERGAPLEPPGWTDLLLARRYQSVVKSLLRSGLFPAAAPSELFDGPSFYSLCREERAAQPQQPQQSAAAASPPPRTQGHAATPPPSLVPLQAMSSGGTAARRREAKASGGAPHAGGTPTRRREGFGKCAECGRQRRGEYDDSEAEGGGGTLYCKPCWLRYEASAPTPPLAPPPSTLPRPSLLQARAPPPSPASPPTPATPSVPPPQQALPVDAHEDEVVDAVLHHRVVIVCGETGCGKSSRVPLFLLPHGRDGRKARIMVAQPRRIAAYGLYERGRATGLAELVGLRMGNDTKLEGPRTRLWYVTTGYLTRLASYRPEALRSIDYLILDECHERSIDSDLLCLMARRLLDIYPRLRVVLMSATISTDLFHGYFAECVGEDEVSAPLHVGGVRFPITPQYLDDVAEMAGLPDRLRHAARRLAEKCDAIAAGGRLDESSDGVAGGIVAAQLELAVWVARLVASAASAAGGGGGCGAVLVFVGGLSDIEELAEELQGSAAVTFVPVHGDLDLDEQLKAFAPAEAGTTKVIAATNAAESSVTLPDVDVVVDLGGCKTVRWDQARHCAVLSRTWVSRASATQRAGRTGRVRPGTCYRLYSRGLHEAMAAHEPSQMKQQPLESTVLQLRSMLAAEARVSELLDEALEPPDRANLGRALLELRTQGFLRVEAPSAPSGLGVEYDDLIAIDELDKAQLTQIGAMAAALPLDLPLARLVAYGVQFGCAAQAIVLAAALSLPKPPFRAASPLTHPNPEAYAEVVRLTAEGRRRIDGGQYSEPLSMIALLAALRRRQEARAQKRRRGGGRAHAEAGEASTNADEDEGEAEGEAEVEAEDGAEAEVEAEAEAEAEGDGARRRKSRPRVRMERADVDWCAKLGLVPRLMRQFVSTVANLQRLVGRACGVAEDQLLPPHTFPSAGREGSFELARLRALLVWTFPGIIMHASLPARAARAGSRAGRARRGGEASDGPSADTGPGADSVQLNVALTDAQLCTLLPPPLQWSSSAQRCDIVQVARAVVPTAEVLIANVERIVIPWLRPAFVFVQTPSALLVWADGSAFDAVRNVLANILRLSDAEVEQAARDARPLLHPGGGGASDPLSYGPAPRDAAEEDPELYLLLRADPSLSPAQQRAFDSFRSRRGVASVLRVFALRVQPDATASLLAANCESLAAPLRLEADGRPGRASLSANGLAAVATLVGADAQCRLQPGQAIEKQTLTFEADSPSAGDLGATQPALLSDRPWGLRLLCLMAAGYRDRKMRVSVPSASGAPAPAGDDALVVSLGVSEGLEWRIGALTSDDAPQRVLLPRHSLLKVALPAEAASQRLWAVGSSVMQLGNAGSSLTAVEGVTLLPPGDEWLTAVILASGEDDSVDEGERRSALPSIIYAAAERVAAAQPRHELCTRPEAVVALRELFEPWLAGSDEAGDEAGDEAAAGEARDADCPICYSVLSPSGQLPRVRCGTCGHRFQ